jgi:hypothetical protein
MTNDKHKTEAPERKRQDKKDRGEKGQYGALTGLGPGGGRDIDEAMKSDDVDPDDTGSSRD